MKEFTALTAGFILLASAAHAEVKRDAWGCDIRPVPGTNYYNDVWPGQCRVPEGRQARTAFTPEAEAPGKDRAKGNRGKRGDRGRRGGKGHGAENGNGEQQGNRSGLGDGTNPGRGGGRSNSPNQGTNNPSNNP